MTEVLLFHLCVLECVIVGFIYFFLCNVSMVGVTLRDKKRSEWVREQTRVKNILMDIKKKKWMWAGHVM